MKKLLPILYIALVLSFTGCEEMLLGPEAENNPKSNFEVLWKKLDENYALFPVKKVNWDSVHNTFGARITSTTTESELWNIFDELLQTLDDGHIALVNKGISKALQSSSLAKRKMDDFSLALIKNKYLENIKVTGKGYITYGKVKQAFTSGNIGYIHVSTFSSPDGSNWALDIDKAVQDLYESDAIIVDLRNNGGGLRLTLTTIASAFIDRPITYFYQQEKTGPGHYDFGSPIPLTVEPRKDAPRYTKKLALLTNRFSASASEHFSHIMNFMPNVTQIGDTTFGAFGDIVSNSELPNGWVFWYPVRLTKTPEGFCPEGIGIIPDILIENTHNDIARERDKVMLKALEQLSRE